MLFNIQMAANAAPVQIDISAASVDSLRQYGRSTIAGAIEAQHGTVDREACGSVAQQLAVQMGINPQSRLSDVMDAKHYRGPSGAQAATTGNDGTVTGRLVLQAVLFDAVENQMREDTAGYVQMLRNNAALNRSVDGTTWETPVLDFKRPENAKPQPIAQLSEPVRMLTLQTSMKRNAIMGESIGIEFSDQVAQNVTIDVVALSIKRMLEETQANMAMYLIMALLNGDVDFNMPALATVVRGGAAQADQLDSTAGNGKLTQTAWVKWLWRNNLRRTITTVVTDLAGALAIENREGRPNVMGDNANSKRIDTLDNILNPRWPDKVDVIITQDPAWPANTIVGFDKRFGYNYITSSVLDYKATEEFAIRRSTKMRMDSGAMVERFMNDAWDILEFS